MIPLNPPALAEGEVTEPQTKSGLSYKAANGQHRQARLFPVVIHEAAATLVNKPAQMPPGMG